MKRLIWLPLLIAMLALAACGAAETPVAEPTAAPETTNTDTADTAETEAVDTAEPEPVEATAEPVAEEPADNNDESAASDPATASEDPFDALTTVQSDDWLKGADDPLLTIIDYSDFQCPGCSAVAPLLSRLVEEYPDEVQVAYRHFPLDNIHPFAFLVAEASEAAGAQGMFWEYHDAIFENQGELNAIQTEEEMLAFLVDAADDLGLDAEQVAADLEAGTYTEAVGEEQLGAIEAGLPGTPALIVNGQLLQGTPPYEAWVDFLAQLRQMTILEEMQYEEAPEMTIDETATYLATVTMANGGEFVIELLPQSAPLTVNNFIFLANEGWYDGVSFHRVLPGFVAQTGDPTGTGMGGPGYFIPNEVDPELSHAEAGMVAMANSGPDTNGSQWYVTLGDASFLDGGYTIFGRVIEGMDVVQAITPRDPQTDPNAPEGDLIETITIAEQ